jgi:hypothetical protein
VCHPFSVVMWFVGGGCFPGPLPPATLPAPFQGASSSTSSSTSRTFQSRCSIYYAPGTAESINFVPPNAHVRSPELNLNVRTKTYSFRTRSDQSRRPKHRVCASPRPAEGAAAKWGRAWHWTYPVCPLPRAGFACARRTSGSTAPTGWVGGSGSAAGASAARASSSAPGLRTAPLPA